MPYKKRVSPEEALKKLASYCAYQERCHKEVKEKLYGMGLFTDDVNWVIAELISENFLNERRYAEAFVRGKFNYKKWGRIKIINALKQNAITRGNIAQALKQIDDEEYRQALKKLLSDKQALAKDEGLVLKNKLTRYAVGKGYEFDIIDDVLSDLSL